MVTMVVVLKDHLISTVNKMEYGSCLFLFAVH